MSMNNKRFLGLLAIAVMMLLAVAPAAAQKGFTITGKVTGAADGKVYFSYTINETRVQDSVMMKNGSFTIKGKVPGPVYSTLRMQGIRGAIGIFVENTIITVETDTARSFTRISGSASHKVYEEFAQTFQYVHEKAGPIYRRIDAAHKAKDTVAYEAAAKELKALGGEADSLFAAFVMKHAASPVAPFVIIDRFVNYANPQMVELLYPKLKPSALKSVYGKQLTQYRTIAARTAIGARPAFAQADTSGKPISLQSFRGKYVLVDFWASWCAPCRKENPFLVAAYNKYHEKGFEVLGVSLDDKKDRWLKAIAADGLPWQQVSDLKGWKNELAVRYGIRSIPANFLLDREGRIIAKNLRGKELEEKLAELLP
jgi:thiol-disulfide isomerase/thioredoxin